MDATEILDGARVVPVIVLKNYTDAVPLAETLFSAGLSVIEVTLRTAIALQAIEAIAKSVPEMIVGAGSLRTAEQVREASHAGADFGVSPGASNTLIDACKHHNLPFIPGAVTPSESIALAEQGFLLQKLFPAEVIGGIPYLMAISAPLPEIMFMPTGGITAAATPKYLSLSNVSCVGGTWVVDSVALGQRDFESIGRNGTSAARL